MFRRFRTLLLCSFAACAMMCLPETAGAQWWGRDYGWRGGYGSYGRYRSPYYRSYGRYSPYRGGRYSTGYQGYYRPSYGRYGRWDGRGWGRSGWGRSGWSLQIGPFRYTDWD